MDFSYKIGKDSYQLVPAEVLSVNYKDSNIINLYSIRARLLQGDDSQNENNTLSARLLDHNIKKIPLVGEIVMILRGPSSNASAFKVTSENYYLTTYSIQNSGHLNQLPNSSKFQQQPEKSNYNVSFAGISNRDSDESPSPAKSFKENPNVKYLQPFAGDLIFEGRNGQSLRFSSTLNETSDYTKKPTWKGDVSGNPITILTNGINNSGQTFTVEDINKDHSSIYLTSNQQLFFKPASTFSKSISDKVGNYKKDNFKGNQIGLFSDRVLVNSNSDTLFFSKSGIGFSTEGNIGFDSSKTFEINSSKINLGYSASQQAVLGNDLQSLLSDIITVLTDLNLGLSALSSLATPVIPINEKIKILLPTINTKLNTILSDLVYLNRK